MIGTAVISFIDISNHQGRDGLKLSSVLPSVGGVICKATEGTGYVDPYCDGFVQTCRKANKPWGFYHFNGLGGAKEEAAYFLNNTVNYFGEGIPILDWEYIYSNGNGYIRPVSWVNEFVRMIQGQTGVWPWIYGNAWLFNQGGVEPNCGRWVAGYPLVTNRDPEYGLSHDCPYRLDSGLMCAWQFTSTGRVSGYSGNLDCNVFYGDTSAWRAYVAGDNASSGGTTGSGSGSAGSVSGSVQTLENDDYKVTIERKHQ